MSKFLYAQKQSISLDSLYSQIDEMKKLIEAYENNLDQIEDLYTDQTYLERLNELYDELDHLEREYRAIEEYSYEDSKADYEYDRWKGSRHE